MSLWGGGLCAFFFIGFQNLLPQWFTGDSQVINTASMLLVWAAIFQIGDSVQANAAGLMRGRQEMKFPTYFVIFAYWVITIPLCYYLGFSQHLGIQGIWIGLSLGLTLAALGLTWKTFNFRKSIEP